MRNAPGNRTCRTNAAFVIWNGFCAPRILVLRQCIELEHRLCARLDRATARRAERGKEKMRVFSLIAGLACLVEVLLDAFQTIILPRRATGRLRVSRLFLTATWLPWRAIARRMHKNRRRESFLSYFGPLSLLLLVAVWAAGLVLGFALLYRGIGSPFTDTKTFGPLETDLYVSGTTLFTLGLGDVVPQSAIARMLVMLEAGTGLGFVAGVIGYLPVLYGAFASREVSIILLDARAGSPPSAVELLRRHAGPAGALALQTLLVEWERWSAQLLESHISYPQLCFFRSQHDNQSWLSALVAILDACALLIATMEGESVRQAQLTFAMARHAVLDLAHSFPDSGRNAAENRLTPSSVDDVCRQLADSGFTLCAGAASVDRLQELLRMYEPQAQKLSRVLMQPLPRFSPEPGQRTSWTTVALLRSQTEASLPSAASMRNVSVTPAVTEDEHFF